MLIAVMVVVTVAFLGLLAALVYALLVVSSMAENRARCDDMARDELIGFTTTAMEKALAFSDDQRETMRIQREESAKRDESRPNGPTVSFPVPPPNFVDGAELRVGG